MPKLVDSLQLTVYRILKTVNSTSRGLSAPDREPLTVNFKSFGFTLIELMIVISLFGIAASLITASYLTFERSQRLKSAAAQLKSDIRLIQNKATSGDKGPQSGSPADTICPRDSSLGGWYLSIAKTQTSYTTGLDCVKGLVETKYQEKTTNLPRDVRVNKISYTPNPDLDPTIPLVVFFRPLANAVSFHDGRFVLLPDFFDNATGTILNNPMPQPPQSAVTIEFINSSGSTYQVKIQPTGEINEVKP